jgi:hypothetical protein
VQAESTSNRARGPSQTKSPMSARAWLWFLPPAAGMLMLIMTRKLRQRRTAPVAALETTGVRARTMRAIVWLQVSLRISDNEAIASAASRADELIICVVWRHGRNCIPTAAAAFEAAAIAALDRSLQPLGQRVCVLYAAGGGAPEAAAAAVAELASRARVDEIIVDGSGAAGAASTAHLQAALVALAQDGAHLQAAAQDGAHGSTHALRATSEEPWLTKLHVRATSEEPWLTKLHVRATSEEPWLLLPSKYALRALGRSRAGGGGKVLRWAAFPQGRSACKRSPRRPALPTGATLGRIPQGVHGRHSCAANASRRAESVASPAELVAAWRPPRRSARRSTRCSTRRSARRAASATASSQGRRRLNAQHSASTRGRRRRRRRLATALDAAMGPVHLIASLISPQWARYKLPHRALPLIASNCL